ncbi:hypothetical protein [Limnoglobus roseus]|uniref:Uncharacterized protein n=1 Tax=Limnoglobus roseus TaxID=2598579 RepID=A0A5C1APN9_9BACT|nr:hypothetical protein [Limnoglobus roseus]QEL20555.1 hypothetical protein PX52LOC_07660 [Limnoglobus roseus]
MTVTVPSTLDLTAIAAMSALLTGVQSVYYRQHPGKLAADAYAIAAAMRDHTGTDASPGTPPLATFPRSA